MLFVSGVSGHSGKNLTWAAVGRRDRSRARVTYPPSLSAIRSWRCQEMHKSFATLQDDNDLLLAARWKAAERVVFDLCYCRTAAALRTATDWRRDIRIRIAWLSGILAKQAFQKIENDSESRAFFLIPHKPPIQIANLQTPSGQMAADRPLFHQRRRIELASPTLGRSQLRRHPWRCRPAWLRRFRLRPPTR